jgi:hypothetical protein
MSTTSQADAPECALRTRRVVVVLAGAATAQTATATALERAAVPHLQGLAERGRCGRLRAVAPHLPLHVSSAYVTLLGSAAPQPLDAARIAAEAAGASIGAAEHCALIRVVDHAGDAAPALHVARAVDVLRGQLQGHRVVALHRGHHIVLAGGRRPVMPLVDGLVLQLEPAGWVPQRAPLDASTVVVAVDGATILGVARMLGARTEAVERAPGTDARQPVSVRLRSAATAALLGGARTVIVESAAPLAARRRERDERARERAVAAALSRLDRELIGPLHMAAAWQSADFVVTADVARLSAGRPVAGTVPVIWTDRSATSPGRTRPQSLAQGMTPPAPYSERGVADCPIVTSPFTAPQQRDPQAPSRFRRDASTGVTVRVRS